MVYKKNFKKGFSIAELIISIFIISILSISIGNFTRDIFFLNSALSGGMNAQLDARHLVKVAVAELREASPSNLGAYPISLASSTGITFYSDINNDGLKDRIRYFLSGKTIKRGVVVPSGNPLTYNDSDEKLSTLISDVVASSTLPIFQYYSGSEVQLIQPVVVSNVRLVKITVIIDADPNHPPAPIIVTSQVSIRNLKDNI